MSRSMAISLVRAYLERRLEPLRQTFSQRWPDRRFPLQVVDGDGEEANRILRNELYKGLYNVTPDFMVLDIRTGFIGVFKSYGLHEPSTPEPKDDAVPDKVIAQAINDLINDLRQLAYVYECQRYEEKEVRPPSYVLFAVLPAEAKDMLPEKLRLAEQNERLLEAVGLSRLLWAEKTTEQALAHWSQVTLGASDPEKENARPIPEVKGSQPVPEEGGQTIDNSAMLEVERFFAPLLLRTRTMTITGTEAQAKEWTRRYLERVDKVLAIQEQPGATPLDATRAEIQAAVRRKLRDCLVDFLASSRQRAAEAESEPVRLVALEHLRQFRRFRENLPKRIPFGRKMTIVYGTNGSGKTSLLEAVTLGLTGHVVRPGEGGKDEIIPETAVAHLGKPTQDYGTLVYEQEQPGEASPREVRRRLIYSPRARSEHKAFPEDILKTFVLTQSNLRSFLTMDGRKRYEWMATHLGLDANQATQAIETLQRELQTELSVVLSKHDVIHRLRIDTDGLVDRWERKYSQNLDSLEDDRKEVARLAQLAQQALLELEAVGLDSPILDKLEEQLVEIDSVLKKLDTALAKAGTALKLGEPLGQVLSQVDHLADSLNTALARLSPQVPDSVLETVERPPSSLPLSEQIEADPKEVYKLRQELENLERAASWLQNAYNALARTQEWLQRAKAVEAGLQAIQQVPDLLPSLEVARIRKIPDEIADILDWLQQSHCYMDHLTPFIQELQDQLSHVKVLQKKRREHMQHLMASLRPNQALMEAQTQYWEAVTALLAAFGLSLPAHEGEPESAPAGTFSPAVQIPGWESLRELARVLPQLGRVSIQTFDKDWLKIMEGYFQPPQKDDWGGLYARLYAWDMLQKVRAGITRAASYTIHDILNDEFGSVLREIHWTLTGTNWGHFPVNLPVTNERNAYRVELNVAFNPSDPKAPREQVIDILNTAEQNILALAFLFTAYLYVGSRWSKAIVLDDPFQNLDDINLLGFVRLVDDVVTAIGAEQLVIALHQEGIKEYLVGEFAHKEPPERKRTNPQNGKDNTGKPKAYSSAPSLEPESSPPQTDFVLIEAFQTSDSESSLRVFQWQYRDWADDTVSHDTLTDHKLLTPLGVPS